MNAKLVNDFFGFMRERETIRLRKEAGLPWPWTEDKILQEFKFTNVKRDHDRTTYRLVNEFYEPNRDSPPDVQLFNCALYRYFGTIEFAHAVGWQTGFNPERIKAVAKARLAAGERVFTGAYVITNQGIKAPKQDVVVDIFLAGVWANREAIVAEAHKRHHWRDMIIELQKVPGFGGTGFMAKEVALDTILTSMWPGMPEDFNMWCPAGPGARRGINRLLGVDLKRPMKTDVAVTYMRGLLQSSAVYWRADFVELTLHDIQFQLCEFDKYERVRLGQGRPRSKYRPPPEGMGARV